MPASMRESAERGWRNLPLRYKGAAVIAIPIVCVLLEVAWLGTRRHLEFAQGLGAGFTVGTCRLAQDYLRRFG